MKKDKLPDLVIGDMVINPPIIQGGMGARVSLSSLASAVSNCGGLGVIASVGLASGDVPEDQYEGQSLEGLRSEIRKTKKLTQKPFGVNIMFALTNFESLVKISIEEGASAIISGAGLPLNLPSLTEGSDIKLIPIVSSGRAASIILRVWKKRYNRLPDAIVVEGPLAGGHLGFNYTKAVGIEEVSLEDIVTEVLKVREDYQANNNKIPVVAAGGIFTGKDIAKMLRIGASGVQMATRFVGTEECDAHPKYKEVYLKSKEDDIVVILSPAGMPARVIKNGLVEKIQAGEKLKFKCPFRCLKTCDPYAANYCIADALINAYGGNLSEGFAMCGANAYRVKKIVSVKELMNELTSEAIKEYYG
ncbi:MAG: nitronate monooxygenase family protein [Candidatus Omnitrophica bacterium]|nr:nitronate monooxygenase family protein [Candidatus Omnitrophota bacterium]